MILPYLLFLLFLLFVEFTKENKEGFVSETLMGFIIPPSPTRLIEGLHQRVQSLIPYKNQLNKLKRQFRMR